MWEDNLLDAGGDRSHKTVLARQFCFIALKGMQRSILAQNVDLLRGICQNLYRTLVELLFFNNL